MTELRPHEILRLDDRAVVVLDQRLLPADVVYLKCGSASEVAEAIRTLAVRGAPAIGIAAAYGYALAAAGGEDLDEAAAVLLASRPTAVNLPWAIAEMRAGDQDADALAARARALHEEEVERCRRMAEHAAGLLEPGTRALTHCNAGALATGGVGTALGAIREGFERGLVTHVFVDETRPLLQGARLTAWELERAGVPHSVLADSAAGSLIARGEVDAVLLAFAGLKRLGLESEISEVLDPEDVVPAPGQGALAVQIRRGDVDAVLTGADRIAANGDAANKIGTYPLAVVAARHGIPFYVVAPTSTVDLAAASGADIPIEERDPAEVSDRFAARNPAFDVTPAELIAAIVTEEGVHRAPFAESLAGLHQVAR